MWNWGGFGVELRGFWCGTEGFLVWNWGIFEAEKVWSRSGTDVLNWGGLCGTEGYSSPNDIQPQSLCKNLLRTEFQQLEGWNFGKSGSKFFRNFHTFDLRSKWSHSAGRHQDLVKVFAILKRRSLSSEKKKSMRESQITKWTVASKFAENTLVRLCCLNWGKNYIYLLKNFGAQRKIQVIWTGLKFNAEIYNKLQLGTFWKQIFYCFCSSWLFDFLYINVHIFVTPIFKNLMIN